VKRNGILWVTLVLVLIGGLNWGLVGFLHFDLVAAILGKMSAVVEIVALFMRRAPN